MEDDFGRRVSERPSAAALVPGKGFKQLYIADGNSTPYSILANLVLTF